MFTIGINAALRDPSACLVQDGRVIAAAEEEWFRRIETGCGGMPFSAHGLPFFAIDYCLREAGIVLSDVDHIAYSFNPFLLLDDKNPSVLLALEPGAAHNVLPGCPEWNPLFIFSVIDARRQLSAAIPYYLRERLGTVNPEGPFVWHFVDHHLAHAVSAFFSSPFASSAVMTLDSWGEKASSTYSLGSGNGFLSLGEVALPHSLGLLMRHIAAHLGLEDSSSCVKELTAMAAFGTPAYASELRRMLTVGTNGQFSTALLPLESLFPARAPHEPVQAAHLDLASSFQTVLQEAVLQIAEWLKKETGENNLCISGSLALNYRLSGFLRESGPFAHVWVHPAAGDAGTSLGAALWTDMMERAHSDVPRGYAQQELAGPRFGDEEIGRLLRKSHNPFRRMRNIASETAELLGGGCILGWFQGRMDLGAPTQRGRAIIASPKAENIRVRLNSILGRQAFHPAETVVSAEDAGEWFSWTSPAPLALHPLQIVPGKIKELSACSHPDGSAHGQILERMQDPLLHELLKMSKRVTGMPVLIHSPFSVKHTPAVCSPEDALACFWTSGLDALVMGPYLVQKKKTTLYPADRPAAPGVKEATVAGTPAH